jgi:AraC-like DNA-binding protein
MSEFSPSNSSLKDPPRLNLSRLHETIQRLYLRRTANAFRVGQHWYLHAGYETRRAADEYSWDGEKRGGDPQHPYIIFQYTLDGWGAFEENGQVFKCEPGSGFAAVVPSPHRYFLPPESSNWTFFWATFHHDYITVRLREHLRNNGGFVRAEPHSRLLAQAVFLLEIWARSRDDIWEEERALFDFLIEFERFGQSRALASTERESWLDDTRRFVLERLERNIAVEELAARHGMSRSYFTHRFKAATGRSPARWMQHVRLEEAARRLLYTDQKLETIARATGLQNANHLCKVFRRRFHLSPGEFRRHMK